jgi:hypothetical protein
MHRTDTIRETQEHIHLDVLFGSTVPVANRSLELITLHNRECLQHLRLGKRPKISLLENSCLLRTVSSDYLA